MEVPDIYFEEFWGELNTLLYEGTHCTFIYEDEDGTVLNRFIRRPVDRIDGYFDILSPWRYCGPYILTCRPGRRDALTQAFAAAFGKYCADNGIVAEFVRFSPWLRNHADFKSIYELVPNSPTIGIDLTGDFFHEEFSDKRRGNVRKAEKCGVRIEFDFDCKTADVFYGLYLKMVEKNSVETSSILSRRYIETTFEKCRGQIIIINGIVEGHIASSGVFLRSAEYLHYHLCGNDPAYFGLDVNALITFHACRWGKEQGKRTLHIGSAPDEGLFRYKKLFTRKGFYDYFSGKRIHLPAVYDKLVEMKGGAGTSYFPEYR